MRGLRHGIGLKLAALAFVAALCVPRPRSSATAQSASVPASLQAELIAKLEPYDRNFSTRAGSVVRTLLLVKADDAKSELSANEMKSAFKRLERIGGLTHQERIVEYTTATELAQRCRAEHIAIVYVAAGLEDAIDAIRGALSGANVLTVGALVSYVPKGVVLGFDLESGRPKITINLEQAKRQNVFFSPDVLRLMRVHR